LGEIIEMEWVILVTIIIIFLCLRGNQAKIVYNQKELGRILNAMIVEMKENERK